MTEVIESNAGVFANESSFRAELEKLQAAENIEAPQPVIEEVPQDVADATTHEDVPISMDGDDSSEVSSAVDADAEPVVETKGHLIPKSRFNQEIEKRKALEEQLAKEREERIRYATQLEMLNSIQQQSQSQQPTPQHTVEEIDPLDTDTYNYAKREIEALKAQLASVSQETEARTREIMYTNRVTQDEANFQKDHPDFNDAFKHVQDVEFNIAKDLLGDDAAARDYVAAKMRDALTRSVNNGKNAAETIYNMAKTYGYNTTSGQPKALPTKDVGAIAKNMARSANTGNLGNSSSFGNIPSDISAALDSHGRVDPAAFHKMLNRLQ
jgi:hypothetical protein